VIDSRLEMRNSTVMQNELPYGAALEIAYTRATDTHSNFVTLTGNQIRENRLSNHAASVQIANRTAEDIIYLTIQGNMLMGQDGPSLELLAYHELQGEITCNRLLKGAVGLSVRSDQLPIAQLAMNIRDNAIEGHTPPAILTDLKYGVGRGASSDIQLDMRNNWWESDTGPYVPDRHADGRGAAVGINILFDPWLRVRPSCAP